MGRRALGLALVSLEHHSSCVSPMEVVNFAYPHIGKFGDLKIRIEDESVDASRAHA